MRLKLQILTSSRINSWIKLILLLINKKFKSVKINSPFLKLILDFPKINLNILLIMNAPSKV